MNPHPRIRKILKWSGLAMTLLLVVLWIGSKTWLVGWWNGSVNEVGVACGCLRVAYATHDQRPPGARSGWHFKRAPRANPFFWWYQYRHAVFIPVSPTAPLDHLYGLWLPLWMPAAIALAGTAVCWGLDLSARRRARTHCPTCGYDRAGLGADAMCPECGTTPSGPESR